MENYEEMILEKGKEKLNYIEIGLYYINVIYNIYDKIEKEYPSQDNEYSDEYLDAYNCLQKAQWGLDDLYQLKEYINEPDFKYFAIEILTNARNRIHAYFKNNQGIGISEEYSKYDKILKIKENICHDKEYKDSFRKYKKIMYQESEIKHLTLYIKNIKKYTTLLKNELTNGRLQYIETSELLETVKLLEKIEKDLTIKEARNTNGR